MKNLFIICLLGSIIFIGAGCSKKNTIVSQPKAQENEALVKRRTSEPPAPPVNIPPPTPVNTVDVVK